MARRPQLRLSGNERADALISKDAFALLIGLVLDQQIPLEWAFQGPLLLSERIPVPLTPEAIAEMDPAELAEAFRTRPALHRFPGSMAERTQDLARAIVADYGGRTENIWETANDANELRHRLQALPGFGAQKARIFLAFLGKQLGVRPKGWREESEPFGEEGSRRSIADIVSAETLNEVRQYKKAAKEQAKAGH